MGRKRIGCDICKEEKSTQKFVGYLDDELWICGKCFREIIKPLNPKKRKRN